MGGHSGEVTLGEGHLNEENRELQLPGSTGWMGVGVAVRSDWDVILSQIACDKELKRGVTGLADPAKSSGFILSEVGGATGGFCL